MMREKQRAVKASGIVDYISRVNRMISNREIAGFFGVSPRWIETVFKREYGMTIHRYAAGRMLERSCPYLMMKPALPLDQIAARFGFFDAAHYSKAFKNRFGMSPRQYRDAHRTEEKIRLTFDHADGSRAVFRSDIAVFGRIESEKPIPDDAVLTVTLEDHEGHVLRAVRQTRKNDDRLYLYHPQMVAYSESDDPGRKGILKFGFPELLVEDLQHPMDSFRNASIKCWYDDHTFKAVFISATDPDHGKIFNDGIGFTDETGQPYEALPIGTYLIRAVLTSEDELLAGNCTSIEIWEPTDQAIVRFNPPSHRERISKWCSEMGFTVADDILPGYLSPYLGKWYYHMGLLPLYRANDIAYYQASHVHMFVYLIDPESTSFATELSYLQKQGMVGEPNRFTAYHYDIGEAEIGQRKARILPFREDEELFLCRLDRVNDQAKDNSFELDMSSVEASYPDSLQIEPGSNGAIGVMGVVKPFQMDPDDFTLQPDNTYALAGPWLSIRYEIDDGSETEIIEKPVLLERFVNGKSIGKSMFEFYHVLKFNKSGSDTEYKVRMQILDKTGLRKTSKASFIVRRDK